MKYYHNLYLSDELKEKKEGIIYKLEHDKIQLNKYVIVLADGFEEALYLVEKIAQEVYDVTGDMKIRKYLLEQQKKFEEGKV